MKRSTFLFAIATLSCALLTGCNQDAGPQNRGVYLPLSGGNLRHMDLCLFWAHCHVANNSGCCFTLEGNSSNT